MHPCPLSPFVPREYEVPKSLEVDEFRLRTLTVNDVVKDYDAVMSSVEHCKTVWPGSKWPDGLTLEQNLIDLGWHQKEFQTRRSFAYTVVRTDESKVLGCVYILPTRKPGLRRGGVPTGRDRVKLREDSKIVYTQQSRAG